MADPSTPENGARFVFERGAQSTDAVCYAARVLAPERSWAFELRIALPAGECVLSGDEAAPEWVRKYVDALSKQLARNGLREDFWPRDIRRWKAPPKG